jgi:transposase
MGRLTFEQRTEAVLSKNQGESYTSIAKRLGVLRLAILNLIMKHRDTGSVNDSGGRGRKRATTERQDRQLVRKSLQNRRLTSTDLRQVLATTGVEVTSQR